MPRLQDSTETLKIGGRGFTFSGTKIDHLGATEYTLVTVATDETGSVSGFADELRKMLIMAVEACKKSPRSDNILMRVITFSDKYPKGVKEIHGFKPLAEIDTAAYPDIRPGGSTPLCDACYSSIGATNAYGEQLSKQDFGVNGICFVITDGDENSSVATMAMIKEEIRKSISGEKLESMISILIGINVADCQVYLDKFYKDSGLTQYVDAGNATPRR